MFTAAVITVSDRSHQGERPDEGGPRVQALLEANGYQVIHRRIVPDEIEAIEEALIQASDVLDIPLIVTTGGTGFAPRDVTPEATIGICHKLVPGIPEAMRSASLQITPRAMLSRAAAGIRSRSLIVNLPGSPKAAEENLRAVIGALDHGLVMLRGQPMNCAELS